VLQRSLPPLSSDQRGKANVDRCGVVWGGMTEPLSEPGVRRTLKRIFSNFSTLKMESTSSSRMLVTIYKRTQCHIPDEAVFIVAALRISTYILVITKILSRVLSSGI
jgi:hypothetical protein